LGPIQISRRVLLLYLSQLLNDQTVHELKIKSLDYWIMGKTGVRSIVLYIYHISLKDDHSKCTLTAELLLIDLLDFSLVN